MQLVEQGVELNPETCKMPFYIGYQKVEIAHREDDVLSLGMMPLMHVINLSNPSCR